MHRMSHVKLCSLTTYHIFLVEVGEISLENHMLSSSLYALKYKCKLYFMATYRTSNHKLTTETGQ